jgi:ligand-binding sensor protein
MNYTLKELLDVPKLQELLDALDEVHCLPSAIIDIEGNILTATAWQDICSKFHRVNPDTEKKCIESDLHINASLAEKTPHIIYRCPLGLVDTATPIIIEGNHLGNVFTGQLFMEPPDESYFKEQGRHYGFDEDEYLAAMRKVPLFSEDQLHKNLTLLQNLLKILRNWVLKSNDCWRVRKGLTNWPSIAEPSPGKSTSMDYTPL